jgi:hypothetical protein
LFVLLFFSKAKKELSLVAFFCQEKIQQSFTRLSTTIGARGAEVSFQPQSQFSVFGRSFQSRSSTILSIRRRRNLFSVLSVFSVRNKPTTNNQQPTTKKTAIIFY